jgi:DNA-binding CsgD family transcriptional regulator
MTTREAPWLKHVTSATTLAEFKDSLALTVRHLGFRYFFYRSHIPQLPQWLRNTAVYDSPGNWLAYCRREGVDPSFEPLLRVAQQQTTPVLWRDLSSFYAPMMEKAREFGLATGVTTLVHAPGAQWSCITFVKERGGPEAEREIQETLPRCQLLACHAHEALKRVVRQRFGTAMLFQVPGKAPVSALSKRERECLKWAAIGKTSAEIAGLMPISERTIVFHLANARMKLGASNSREAASKAISLGIIAAH